MTRIRSSNQAGAPGSSVPRRLWPLRPIPFFKQRSIHRTMVNDPADGRTQPEFKNTLGGVKLATANVKRRFQSPQTPPAPGAGTTSVSPARSRVVKR